MGGTALDHLGEAHLFRGEDQTGHGGERTRAATCTRMAREGDAEERTEGVRADVPQHRGFVQIAGGGAEGDTGGGVGECAPFPVARIGGDPCCESGADFQGAAGAEIEKVDEVGCAGDEGAGGERVDGETRLPTRAPTGNHSRAEDGRGGDPEEFHRARGQFPAGQSLQVPFQPFRRGGLGREVVRASGRCSDAGREQGGRPQRGRQPRRAHHGGGRSGNPTSEIHGAAAEVLPLPRRLAGGEFQQCLLGTAGERSGEEQPLKRPSSHTSTPAPTGTSATPAASGSASSSSSSSSGSIGSGALISTSGGNTASAPPANPKLPCSPETTTASARGTRISPAVVAMLSVVVYVSAASESARMRLMSVPSASVPEMRVRELAVPLTRPSSAARTSSDAAESEAMTTVSRVGNTSPSTLSRSEERRRSMIEVASSDGSRSEERRVGKEGRYARAVHRRK